MAEDRITQARWIAVMALTGLCVYLCWLMMEPFLYALMWAAVLKIMFNPVHSWLLARTRRPGLAALLSVLVVMAVGIIPLTLVGVALVYQLAGMGEIAQNLAKSLLTNPEKNVTLQRALEFARRYVDVDQYLTAGSIKSMLSSMSQPVLKGTLRFLGGALGLVANIFLVLFISFYLFRDGEKILPKFVNALPLEKKRAEELIARTRTIIAASVNGVLVIAALQGALGGLMFWILGLPSPLVWGVVMSLLAMLPVGGTAIIWLPAALILIFSGQWVKGVILIAFGALVIGTVDNILRPRLVGGKTGMHDLTIFFSVLGGLKVFGVVGFLLGPVMLAVTFSLLSIYRKEESEGAVEG